MTDTKPSSAVSCYSRRISLRPGWDALPVRERARALAFGLEYLPAFKAQQHRWRDVHRKSLQKRFELLASLEQPDAVIDFHYQFLWSEFETWADGTLSKSRWRRSKVCEIRRPTKVRPE